MCLKRLRLDPLGEREATTSYWPKNNLIQWYSVKTHLTRKGLEVVPDRKQGGETPCRKKHSAYHLGGSGPGDRRGKQGRSGRSGGKDRQQEENCSLVTQSGGR